MSSKPILMLFNCQGSCQTIYAQQLPWVFSHIFNPFKCLLFLFLSRPCGNRIQNIHHTKNIQNRLFIKIALLVYFLKVVLFTPLRAFIVIQLHLYFQTLLLHFRHRVIFYDIKFYIRKFRGFRRNRPNIIKGMASYIIS